MLLCWYNITWNYSRNYSEATWKPYPSVGPKTLLTEWNRIQCTAPPRIYKTSLLFSNKDGWIWSILLCQKFAAGEISPKCIKVYYRHIYFYSRHHSGLWLTSFQRHNTAHSYSGSVKTPQIKSWQKIQGLMCFGPFPVLVIGSHLIF